MTSTAAIADADDLHDDPEVVRVLERYLADVEAGRDPNRAGLIAEHPEIADALAECLDGLDFLRKATGPSDWPNGEQRLGGFRLLRVLGRGGMGTVYEAEEWQTRRRVAVKVLPPAAADGIELKRFQHEIRAAAALDHPNIVPIETVGEENGIHFFSMKLIDGGSLADWQAHPTLAGRSTWPQTPPSESTWHPAEPRLRGDATASYHAPGRDHAFIAKIILQAADALAHAHERGIVHRDVKPANLLLDGNEHVWVADFGLAYVPGLTRLTRSAAMVGTLRYMAPEQVEPRRGAVDHRADLYGLGATFYELLTGQPVFADEDRGRLLARILADEPTPPRGHDAAIPYELETVVLTLLAKEPSRRYASMIDLAEDLRRFLAGTPIRSRRPTVVERGTAWLARHRRVSIVLALTAVAFVGSMLWNQSRLIRERNQTRIEREDARRAVDDFWTTYSETVLDREPERDPRRREYLAKALAYYERLAGSPAAEPRDRLAAIVARRRVADLRVRLGAIDSALLDYDECERHLRDLKRTDTDGAVRESATVAVDRGNLLRSMGRWDDAGRDYKAAAIDFRTLIDNGSTNPFDRAALAGVENNQGLLWQSLERPAEAEACFRSARTKFAQLALDHPMVLADSAGVAHNLAEVLSATGRWNEAERLYRESMSIRGDALETDPDSPRSRREAARTKLQLAELLLKQNRAGDAFAIACESADDWGRLAREHSARPEFAIGQTAALHVRSVALAYSIVNRHDFDRRSVRPGKSGDR